MSNPQARGTSLGVNINSTNEVHLKDNNSNWIFVVCSGTPTIPSATAGYATGCLLIDNTNGNLYINSGTSTSCTFTTKATFS